MWNVGLSLLMIHYKCVWTVLHEEKKKAQSPFNHQSWLFITIGYLMLCDRKQMSCNAFFSLPEL